ncbi:MAG: peptidylprolyl isomerase [Chloroflexi bacterium]|nr:peptidylprolyl isomerase [Anaerolineaceae bacterium]NLI45424.1 peptidylprolyl isomerase [Chloroflexota bacterium]HOT26224.1 peptidylprolyl isomerase [Anaerolineaceae bacterium]HQH58313.1 peptidylprolyl isomerase [Anaerolineaceae bacterium]HQK03954.1 peptidylprolyl isomerase [Anaerolineaceae bacterium]
MTEKILNAVQDDTVVQLAYNLVVDGEEIEFEVLEYLHGHQNIIPGLENALTGLAVGESKEVLVLAEDAYGEFDPDAVVLVSRKSFPPDFEIRLGEPMNLRDASGHVFTGVATALTDETVELDLNHPMAGKDLQFTVTILGIRPATELEIQNGRLGMSCDSCSDGCSDGCCG